jgi:hypothetical protein
MKPNYGEPAPKKKRTMTWIVAWTFLLTLVGIGIVLDVAIQIAEPSGKQYGEDVYAAVSADYSPWESGPQIAALNPTAAAEQEVLSKETSTPRSRGDNDDGSGLIRALQTPVTIIHTIGNQYPDAIANCHANIRRHRNADANADTDQHAHPPRYQYTCFWWSG